MSNQKKKAAQRASRYLERASKYIKYTLLDAAQMGDNSFLQEVEKINQTIKSLCKELANKLNPNKDNQ